MSILGSVVAYLAFLLFLSQVQVEFQVQEEVEGCLWRAAVFRVFYSKLPDYGGQPKIYFCLTEELINDYHLCFMYMVFTYIPLYYDLFARIRTAILYKLPITTDRSTAIIIV